MSNLDMTWAYQRCIRLGRITSTSSVSTLDTINLITLSKAQASEIWEVFPTKGNLQQYSNSEFIFYTLITNRIIKLLGSVFDKVRA